MSQTAASTTAPPVAPASPPARRLTPAGWRDPRLWVGLVLVAASVLVGARVLSAADDTTGVWALTRDLSAGAPLTRDALVVRQVRFTDPQTAGGYLAATQPVPTGAVVSRDLHTGELLARASVGAAAGAAFELPVVVDPAGAPEDLQAGDVVDVWVAPQVDSGGTGTARQVLTAVPVVGAARSGGPFGEVATRQVLLGLGEDGAARLGPVLGRIVTGSVVLVRHGAGR